MTVQAESLLREWARVSADRDRRVLDAISSGVPKARISELTGLARTTIDRITARENLTAGEQARLTRIRRSCDAFTALMTAELADGPDLAAGLRKLSQATDCFARAALPPQGRTQS